MKNFQRVVKQLRMVYPEREARALARWLCEEQFGLTQTDLLLDKDNELSADDLANAQEIVTRLLRHEPIQYILGFTTFCGHRFATSPAALIPRPETQELVAQLTQRLANHANSPRILDIGTGTGCIAISVALALPCAQVTGWDVSEEALALARRNAAMYPEIKVSFEHNDILQPATDKRQWDIIVSNPPYVRQSEAKDMDRNVLDYEPHLALFVPDNDPLHFYRAIGLYAQEHLTSTGSLWLEINQYLSAETAHLIEDFGFQEVEVLNDIHGNPRILTGKKVVQNAKKNDSIEGN